MVCISRNTILKVNFIYCPDEDEIVNSYLKDTYCRALGFEEIGTDLSQDIGDDRKVWGWDISALEAANLVEVTRVSDCLYPFNEEEQGYIVNYLNRMIDEGCEFDNLADLLICISCNTDWVDRKELEEEYEEAAANDDVAGLSFEEWLEDNGHVYYLDKWRVLYQAA